jgi:predicted transcriptional regulator
VYLPHDDLGLWQNTFVSSWAKIANCSADTALRVIKDLIEKGILKQEESGGRSTNYELTELSD